jgi:thiamine pyrophosphokinase
MEERVVIFANGVLTDQNVARSLLRPADFIVAADGGTRHVLALGLNPALLVGDLDSLDKSSLRELEAAGVRLERYPTDKDETDLELAIRHALELKPKSMLIIGALGGRLDHTLGNLSLLSRPELVELDVRADDGLEEVFFIKERAQVEGRGGDLISLIPWGGPVKSVTTEDLRWPLQAETLYPEHTRGISNEMLKDVATVQISTGLLLVIHRRRSPEGSR